MSDCDPENRTKHLDESALSIAEGTLGSKLHIAYDAKQWEAFIAILDSPAQDRHRLRKLLTEPSVLES